MNYPEKIYVVMWKEEPIAVRMDKLMAHAYAEGNFGCKQDGICVDNVSIVSYCLAVPNEEIKL